MAKLQTKDSDIRKNPHSKAFKEGLATLTEEIELALQWNRPSILLAVHNSKAGRVTAQQSLEKEIVKRNRQVKYLTIQNDQPDVIREMSETPNFENIVFFVSGLENADRVFDGKVHRALNIRRELLVERQIRVVFWLNESEAANLARLAPDFWSFRHRVVEFAPKHGTKKQSLPIGLFLWEEQIPSMQELGKKDRLVHYEELLMRLSKETDSIATRAEILLKLVHYSWLLNDAKKLSAYLKDGTALLEKHLIPRYRAWMLNAEAIGLYENGNKEDSSKCFIQALSYDPENSSILINAGIAAHGLGKNGEAIQKAKRAIKKNQGNFQLWHILGYLYLSIGKNEDAVAAMKMAVELTPFEPDLHYSMAVCYYKNEERAECTNEIMRAKKISTPQNAIQRACVSILSDDMDQALAQLKHSLERGEVNQYEIQRDPNLHFLLNSQEFMVTN